MSDMTEMMSRKIFLEVCISIEGLCADMYHYYSEIYKEIPEASQLWNKTALEEESHKRQFGLAFQLLNETEFEISENSLKQAYSILHKLLKRMEHIKINKPELLTAIIKSVEMEEKIADLHVHTSLNFKEESMQKLFKALFEADRGHVTDMKRYQTVVDYQQKEIEG